MGNLRGFVSTIFRFENFSCRVRSSRTWLCWWFVLSRKSRKYFYRISRNQSAILCINQWSLQIKWLSIWWQCSGWRHNCFHPANLQFSANSEVKWSLFTFCGYSILSEGKFVKLIKATATFHVQLLCTEGGRKRFTLIEIRKIRSPASLTFWIGNQRDEEFE